MNEAISVAVVADLYRELEKARDALRAARRHFDSQADADAALHLAEQVRPNPLAARVALAVEQAESALGRYASLRAALGEGT